MSVAFFRQEGDLKVALAYVSDGVLSVCEDLERKGVLPAGGGNLGFLDDKMASEGIAILGKAVGHLSDQGFAPLNTFAATEGNARHCLTRLMDELAKQPNAKVVAWR